MKKIYVSCPVSGRTLEAINKSRESMRKYAEIMLGEECFIVNLCPIGGYNLDKEGKVGQEKIASVKDYKQAIKLFSENIRWLAEADVFIGISSDAFVTCSRERDIAHRLDIPVLLIDYDSCCCFDDVNTKRFVEY